MNDRNDEVQKIQEQQAGLPPQQGAHASRSAGDACARLRVQHRLRAPLRPVRPAPPRARRDSTRHTRRRRAGAAGRRRPAVLYVHAGSAKTLIFTVRRVRRSNRALHISRVAW